MRVSADPHWAGTIIAEIDTTDPRRALLAMNTEATALGCELSVEVEELEPLRIALQRLINGLSVEAPSQS